MPRKAKGSKYPKWFSPDRKPVKPRKPTLPPKEIKGDSRIFYISLDEYDTFSDESLKSCDYIQVTNIGGDRDYDSMYVELSGFTRKTCPNPRYEEEMEKYEELLKTYKEAVSDYKEKLKLWNKYKAEYDAELQKKKDAQDYETFKSLASKFSGKFICKCGDVLPPTGIQSGWRVDSATGETLCNNCVIFEKAEKDPT